MSNNSAWHNDSNWLAGLEDIVIVNVGKKNLIIDKNILNCT